MWGCFLGLGYGSGFGSPCRTNCGFFGTFSSTPACDVSCNGGDQEGSLDSLKSVDFENSVGGSVSMAPPFVD